MDQQQAHPRGKAAGPVRRGTLRPTLEGIGWLLLAILLLYQGWLRSVNLVALLAAFLLGLWLLNWLMVARRYRLKRLEARRQTKNAAFAGQPFTVELIIDNPTADQQYGLRVTDTDKSARQGWLLPVLRRQDSFHQFYSVTIQRRGRHLWEPIEFSTGYPFGLFRRTVRYQDGDSVIVLPRLGRLHTNRLKRLLLQLPRPTASTQRPVLRHPGAQTEFYGLREFRSGDSPRWIHWRTSARVGELMVREFEEPPVDHLIVLLDPWVPEPAPVLERELRQIQQANRDTIKLLLASGPAPSPEKRKAKEAALARKEQPFREPLESLELAVSLCATICWEWCRQIGARMALGIAGRRFTVHVTDTGQRQVYPLLEELALVEGITHECQEESLEPLSTVALPPGPVVLVTTRASGLAATIGQQLRRPVVTLDVRQPELADLFESDGQGGAGAAPNGQRAAPV